MQTVMSVWDDLERYGLAILKREAKKTCVDRHAVESAVHLIAMGRKHDARVVFVALDFMTDEQLATLCKVVGPRPGADQARKRRDQAEEAVSRRRIPGSAGSTAPAASVGSNDPGVAHDRN
jgi:hypothetical protein